MAKKMGRTIVRRKISPQRNRNSHIMTMEGGKVQKDHDTGNWIAISSQKGALGIFPTIGQAMDALDSARKNRDVEMHYPGVFSMGLKEAVRQAEFNAQVRNVYAGQATQILTTPDAQSVPPVGQ